MTEQKYERLEVAGDGTWSTYATCWTMQQFTVGATGSNETFNITKVVPQNEGNTGTPGSYLYIYLRDATGYGTNLSVGSVTRAYWGGGGSVVPMSSYYCQQGGSYSFVFSSSGTGDSSNNFEHAGKYLSSYTAGIMKYAFNAAGSPWTNHSSYDLPFAVFGEPSGTPGSTYYTLTTLPSPAVGGSVLPATGSYLANEIVPVSGIANTGWIFNQWLGNLTGSVNPTTITMDGNKTVSGIFLPYYVLQTVVSPAGAGTVTGAGSYISGTSAPLSGIPNATYGFDQWTGGKTGSANPTTILMNGSQTVSGNFLPYYPLTTSVQPSAGGSIFPSAGSWISGTVIGISGVANPSYAFVNWSGSLTGSANPTTLAMTGSKTVIGSFVYVPGSVWATLTTVVSPAGGGIIAPSAGSWYSGTTIGISGTANSGYEFINWTGDLTESTTPTTLLMDTNKTVSGNFQAIPYFTLTTDVNPSGTGAVGPSAGSWISGTTIAISGVPNAGYLFSYWTGHLTGTTNPTNLTFDGNKSVVANFVTSGTCSSVAVKLTISGLEYTDSRRINLNRSISDTNATSSFTIEFDNFAGRHKSDFHLNDDVDIYSDQNVSTATTKRFSGIVEDIRFDGDGLDERITLTGRDRGAILQDIMVEPRIFHNKEVSDIIRSLMTENVPTGTITWDNVDTTTTTITKITFNNISLFDSLQKLADISGYYFFVDENDDLNFKLKEETPSGITFDKDNVFDGIFKKSDVEIYNKVTVIGDRQLTGAREEFTSTGGSVYALTDKPYNTGVLMSGADNTVIQPGGIINISNPASDDVKYLVDFQGKKIVLTSGTTAGDNILPTGSVLLVDYFRSTPLIKIVEDTNSQSNYGEKHKVIVDRNIKDIYEAADKANAFLSEYKDPKIEGTLKIDGILSVIPGQTAIVNLPYHGINNQNYSIISADYDFNTRNNQTCDVLTVTMNQKVPNILDTLKEQILRLRALEGAETETSITNVLTSTGSIGVSGTGIIISKSIGSGFYFDVPNHNVLNSPTSVLGPWIGGSTVITIT